MFFVLTLKMLCEVLTPFSIISISEKVLIAHSLSQNFMIRLVFTPDPFICIMCFSHTGEVTIYINWHLFTLFSVLNLWPFYVFTIFLYSFFTFIYCRPSYRKLSSLRNHLPDVPILALTATAVPQWGHSFTCFFQMMW